MQGERILTTLGLWRCKQKMEMEILNTVHFLDTSTLLEKENKRGCWQPTDAMERFPHPSTKAL